MKQQLAELRAEFRDFTEDFLVAILALECLEACNRTPELREKYSGKLVRECRRQLVDQVEQYACELSQTAVWIAGRYMKRDLQISIQERKTKRENPH